MAAKMMICEKCGEHCMMTFASAASGLCSECDPSQEEQ